MAPVGIEENILVTMPRLENAESGAGNHSHRKASKSRNSFVEKWMYVFEQILRIYSLVLQ